MNEIKYLVSYQIATYSGTVEVWADADADNEQIIAQATAKIRRNYGPLPFGSVSFRVERSPEFAY